MCEPVVAFMRADDSYPGSSAGKLMAIAVFMVLGMVPLLVGALISPGEKVKEAGLTILISMGFAAFCGVSIVAIFTDPGAKPYLPLMPHIRLAPLAGALNLLLIAGLGWLLYRVPTKEVR